MEHAQGNNYQTADQANIQNALLEQQIELQKKQVHSLKITNLCILIFLISLAASMLFLGPKVVQILNHAETIAAELESANLKETVENIDALAKSSQTGIVTATDKLNQLDLEALNQAIEELSRVIRPLANFFDSFS